MVNIQTKHDALSNFFQMQLWCKISKMNYMYIYTRLICDSHNNLIPELQMFMIPIPTLVPLGLIPILIPISGFTKIYDSDSNSNSSRKWFQFWFRIECFPNNLIPIKIPIPASCDSDSIKPGFDSDSDSDSGIIYNSDFDGHDI